MGIKLGGRYAKEKTGHVGVAAPGRPVGGRLVHDVFAAPAAELEAEAAAAAAAAKLAETPGTVTHMLAHLPPPGVDEADFKGEVSRPMEEVLERFKGHPELAFRKLLKTMRKEEER